MKESMLFLTQELMPNTNLHENLNLFIQELEKILPVSSFKQISKALTEKAINKIKEKIKNSNSDLIKQCKHEGITSPPYSKKDDENCIFRGAIGKYIRGLKIPVVF